MLNQDVSFRTKIRNGAPLTQSLECYCYADKHAELSQDARNIHKDRTHLHIVIVNNILRQYIEDDISHMCNTLQQPEDP
jgi:hypothetical protein